MGGRYRASIDRSREFSDSQGPRGFFGKPTLVVFWLFVVAVCVAVAIPALPQYHLLKEIEGELAGAKLEEERLEIRSQQFKAEARALKENPHYLQERARDPLRYMRKGETIIQIDN